MSYDSNEKRPRGDESLASSFALIVIGGASVATGGVEFANNDGSAQENHFLTTEIAGRVMRTSVEYIASDAAIVCGASLVCAGLWRMLAHRG